MENNEFESLEAEEVNYSDVLSEESQETAEIRSRKAAVKKDKKETTSWQKQVLSYLHDLVYLLTAVMLIFLLCFRVVVVSGTSMNNTLLDGDYLLLLGSTFYHNPDQGDIIVASKDSFDNGAPIVKRVIATEGQEVNINFKTGVVYVDGVALDEPYTLTPTTTYEGVNFPLVVKEGCLFVMGDNRNDSKDSRHPAIGLIDRREVLGKVIFLFLPGTNHGLQEKNFDRIGVVS